MATKMLKWKHEFCTHRNDEKHTKNDELLSFARIGFQGDLFCIEFEIFFDDEGHQREIFQKTVGPTKVTTNTKYLNIAIL